MVSIAADFLATADNVNAYRQSIMEAGLPAALEKEYLADLAKVVRGKSRYFNMFPDQVDSSRSMLAKPQKVAILIDEGCASSAEQFLLEARQSTKVTLYGVHSRGVLDYANVCEKKFEGYSLLYPTSRSRRIVKGEDIENKGIQPH